jgi:hypothetical protein
MKMKSWIREVEMSLLVFRTVEWKKMVKNYQQTSLYQHKWAKFTPINYTLDSNYLRTKYITEA